LTKRCYKCDKEKPFDAFASCKRNKDGLQTMCRECQSKYGEKHRQKPEVKKARAKSHKEWRKKNPEKELFYSFDFLSKQTGFTKEELYSAYNTRYSQQQGRCAICGKYGSDEKRRFALDHNHTTNQIRDVLCNSCNVALGSFNEDVELLEKAIVYLKKHNVGNGEDSLSPTND
jgi:hypothetical protein